MREIETRLTTDLVVNNPSCHDPTIAPVSAAANDAFPAAGALQMDLMIMALACDITRVASMQWSRSVSQTRFTWLNITEGHHDLSHRPDGDPGAVDKLTDINPGTRSSSRRSSPASRQRPTAPAARCSTTRCCSGATSWPRATRTAGWARPTCWPAVRAAALRTGRFLRYDGQGLPHNNLLLSILNAMGVPDRSFGKPDWCTGPLTGLI